MTTRASLALFLLAGSAAHAQLVMRSTYSWTEVIAGTNTPVSAPNSILEPGEGARISLTMTALLDGQSAIDQTVYFSGFPYANHGIVRGLSGMVYSLAGQGADASGTWNSRVVNSTFPSGNDPGYPSANGSRVDSFGGARFQPPGTTINGNNPIANAWRGVWNPANYEPRTVNFKAEASAAVPTGQHNAVHVQFRTDFADPEDPTTEYAIYWVLYTQSDFGAGIDIPIGNGFGSGGSCYSNCDHSTTPPTLTVNDFQCFINAFAAGQSYANCDNSTAPPVLNANDFQCFLTRYAAGCG